MQPTVDDAIEWFEHEAGFDFHAKFVELRICNLPLMEELIKLIQLQQLRNIPSMD